ncbi:hypothetical protein [Ferrimonas sp. SCSIO 43195]|uniref:hypothetical protein n=1 Tax=Ferrimonas sp. SCSIO 43195 TaxID=2822844 RepID=UPI0020755117|nr:hypothetical protein [Ferrimonas sp. SCSIO 43195]USD37818.1 hypothetical protein J8Z22_01120 [Ferrimonas sp. SCSIO 43195]
MNWKQLQALAVSVGLSAAVSGCTDSAVAEEANNAEMLWMGMVSVAGFGRQACVSSSSFTRPGYALKTDSGQLLLGVFSPSLSPSGLTLSASNQLLPVGDEQPPRLAQVRQSGHELQVSAFADRYCGSDTASGSTETAMGLALWEARMAASDAQPVAFTAPLNSCTSDGCVEVDANGAVVVCHQGTCTQWGILDLSTSSTGRLAFSDQEGFLQLLRIEDVCLGIVHSNDVNFGFIDTCR